MTGSRLSAQECAIAGRFTQADGAGGVLITRFLVMALRFCKCFADKCRSARCGDARLVVFNQENHRTVGESRRVFEKKLQGFVFGAGLAQPPQSLIERLGDCGGPTLLRSSATARDSSLPCASRARAATVLPDVGALAFRQSPIRSLFLQLSCFVSSRASRSSATLDSTSKASCAASSSASAV